MGPLLCWKHQENPAQPRRTESRGGSLRQALSHSVSPQQPLTHPAGQAPLFIHSKTPCKPPDSRFTGATHQATHPHHKTRKVFSGILMPPPNPPQLPVMLDVLTTTLQIPKCFYFTHAPSVTCTPPAAACHLPSAPAPTCPSSIKS